MHYLNIIYWKYLHYLNFYSDGILDQRHLQFLAEISSRNLGLNVNEPLVTEPSELDTKPIVERKYIYLDCL